MSLRIIKLLELRRISSRRAKQLGLYSVFVCISFIFWLFLSLNNTIQKDIPVVVKLIDVPDSITIVSNYPSEINVGVKDRGVALIKFILGKEPELKIKFSDYSDGNGHIIVSNSDFRRLVRSLFENTSTILSYSVDNFDIKYTDLPGKSVPIRLDLDIHANMQYVIFGPIEHNIDSVKVFSDKNTLASIEEVYTYHVEEKELKDTLVRTIAISPIPGTKIIPNTITIKIPVEPLITKRLAIPIRVKNIPHNINVMTFPSVVTASFLVPFSTYRNKCNMEAVADFMDLLTKPSKKLAIRIEECPAMYQNISLQQDSVEYIIERK